MSKRREHKAADTSTLLSPLRALSAAITNYTLQCTPGTGSNASVTSYGAKSGSNVSKSLELLVCTRNVQFIHPRQVFPACLRLPPTLLQRNISFPVGAISLDTTYTCYAYANNLAGAHAPPWGISRIAHCQTWKPAFILTSVFCCPAGTSLPSDPFIVAPSIKLTAALATGPTTGTTTALPPSWVTYASVSADQGGSDMSVVLLCVGGYINLSIPD